ncbi:MAG: DUF5655 domain-containing protein [Bacteroides sp.]|nr:DUF5655 domain-containing protein [Bacteroides sp.]
MALYKSGRQLLAPIKEKPFRLEKEIQELFEKHISTIMDIEFVKSEFTIKNKRIDTLCFDPRSKAFIIIEYKRDRNASVVDQGFTYLSLMLQYKSDFMLEYNENMKKYLRRDDVDWSQSQVVFVSTSFTDNQREAANFKDLAIELWEVKRYENDIISIRPIRKSKSAESIRPVTERNKELKQVTDEIRTYTEEEHLNGKPIQMAQLYTQFRAGILNLSDDIEVDPKKFYIAFKKDKNICDIGIKMKSINIYINLRMGCLDDPENLAKDVARKGHWGNGDYMVKVTDDHDLEYIMSLIKQAIVC